MLTLHSTQDYATGNNLFQPISSQILHNKRNPHLRLFFHIFLNNQLENKNGTKKAKAYQNVVEPWGNQHKKSSDMKNDNVSKKLKQKIYFVFNLLSSW